MINLGILKDGGHRIKLQDGPSFLEPESEIALNQWIDLVIEYELGRIRIVVNNKGKTYEHEKVTIINPKANGKHRFTFKTDLSVKLFSTRSGYGSVISSSLT